MEFLHFASSDRLSGKSDRLMKKNQWDGKQVRKSTERQIENGEQLAIHQNVGSWKAFAIRSCSCESALSSNNWRFLRSCEKRD